MAPTDAPAESARGTSQSSPATTAPAFGEPGHGSGAPGLRGALRFWWVVVGAIVLALAVTLLRASAATDSYVANATVYVGQPVSPNGQLLNTVGSKAATAIEIGRGDEALAAAARESGASAAQVREGLEVSAVQSPLASKLANPPTLMRISVRNARRAVATDAAGAIAQHIVAETNTYTGDKLQALRDEIAAYEETAEDLAAARAAALQSARGASGADAGIWSFLISTVGRDLQVLRADLSESKAQLAVADEIEQSRVVSEPSAAKVQRPGIAPSLVMAGLVGAVVGLALALMLNALRPLRS